MMRATADAEADPGPEREPNPPDAHLVGRTLAGDREAYSTLVRRHQAEMFRYARGIGLDYDTAHDVVQDAFVLAYARLDRCRDLARYRQWLMRIVRNRCLDHHRDIRRRTVPIEVLDSATAAAEREGADTRRELRRLLKHAFARLSPLRRDAFLLKHHGGYTYDEMADLADASPSAMKMRVQRARQELQEYLEQADAGPT